MKLISRQTWQILALIATFEALSFTLYFFPDFKFVGGLVLLFLTIYLTWRNLEYGLLLLFVELIIGSKGHLLELSVVSGRMIIFSVILVFYLLSLIKKEERAKLWGAWLNFKSKKPLVTLAVFIIISLIVSLANSNEVSNIFADFNNWLFFLIIFPIISVYFKAQQEIYKRLVVVTTAAFLCLGLETFLILYIYSHNLPIVTDLYLWLRKTGVAEITATANGFPRIFLQSQIYAAVLILITTFSVQAKKTSLWVLTILAWGVIFLSMSRSIWLGLAMAILIGLAISWRQLFKYLLFIVPSALVGALLILLVVIFPLPKSGSFSLDSFANRLNVTGDEAAVASRWSLLPVLADEIKQNPIIGRGFGYSVTYQSSDPRVLENNPSGAYSTYAFEWGYLSLWLKLGIFGLIAYFWLLTQTMYLGYKQHNFLFLSLILIAVIHAFTPYLDHPLGIALILMIIILTESCLKLENNVY